MKKEFNTASHFSRNISRTLSLTGAALLAACGGSGTGSDTNNQSISAETFGVSSNSNSANSLAQQSQNTATIQSVLGSLNSSTTPELGAAFSTNDINPNRDTSFTSGSAAGFTGEVVNDGIQLRWQAYPGARGYNVYKQGDYHETVFENAFFDDDVYDENYYYEIQAFDHAEGEPDNLFYIARGLTVPARTLGRDNPDAPETNEDLFNDYTLVFSDEFSGNELDTSKWNTAFTWGPDIIINSEEQYYVDINNQPDFGFNPFSFDGDNLTINSIETPDNLLSAANGQPYLSGIITTLDKFNFTYGYVETRARMTHGRGYWPAFWLLNTLYGFQDGQPADPEIDIMEFIGHNQDVVYHTYHYFERDEENRENDVLRSTPSNPTVGIDFTSHFHTFGVEWTPNKLVFYVDGIARYEIVDVNVSSEEMYVIANTAIGGWWAGPPDATTPFPGAFEIDYIRVYQKTTPFDDLQLDQPDHQIPPFADSPGNVSPNHKPSFEQWPEGYPDRF